MFSSPTKGWTIRKMKSDGGEGNQKQKKEKNSKEIVNEQIYSYGFWPKKIMPKRKKKFPPYMYKKKILHLLKSPPAHHFSRSIPKNLLHISLLLVKMASVWIALIFCICLK